MKLKEHAIFAVACLMLVIGLRAFIELHKQWYGGAFVALIVWAVILMARYERIANSKGGEK